MRYLIILFIAGFLMGGTGSFAQEEDTEIDPKAQQIIDLEEEFKELSVKLVGFDERTNSLLTAGQNNQALRNMLKDILDRVIEIQTRLEDLGSQLAELRGAGPVKLAEFTILAQIKYFEPSETLSDPVIVNDQITFTALLGFPEKAAPLDTTVVWTLKDSTGQEIEGYGNITPDQGENPTDVRKFTLDTTDLELGAYVVNLTHTLNGTTSMSVTDDIPFTLEAMGEIIITELDVGGIDGGEPDLMGYYTVPKGVENLKASVTLMNTTTGTTVHQDQWAVDDIEANDFTIEIPASMMKGDNIYAFTTILSADGLATVEKTKTFTYIAAENDEDMADETDDDIWGEVLADEEENAEFAPSEDDEEEDESESWEDADKAEDLTTGDGDKLSAYEIRNQLAQKAANAAASDEARNAQNFAQVEEGREEERIRKAEKRAAWGNVLNTIAAGVAQAAVQIQAADQQLDRQLAANKKAYDTSGSAFSAINTQSSAIRNCVNRKNSAPSNGFARMDPHATQMECASEYRNSQKPKKPATQQRSNNNGNTNSGNNQPNFDSLNYTGGNGGLNVGGNSREPRPKTSFGSNNNTDASNEYVPQKREKEPAFYLPEVCGNKYPRSKWRTRGNEPFSDDGERAFRGRKYTIHALFSGKGKKSIEAHFYGVNCQISQSYDKNSDGELIRSRGYYPDGSPRSDSTYSPGAGIRYNKYQKQWDDYGNLTYHIEWKDGEETIYVDRK